MLTAPGSFTRLHCTRTRESHREPRPPPSDADSHEQSRLKEDEGAPREAEGTDEPPILSSTGFLFPARAVEVRQWRSFEVSSPRYSYGIDSTVYLEQVRTGPCLLLLIVLLLVLLLGPFIVLLLRPGAAHSTELSAFEAAENKGLVLPSLQYKPADVVRLEPEFVNFSEADEFRQVATLFVCRGYCVGVIYWEGGGSMPGCG